MSTHSSSPHTLHPLCSAGGQAVSNSIVANYPHQATAVLAVGCVRPRPRQQQQLAAAAGPHGIRPWAQQACPHGTPAQPTLESLGSNNAQTNFATSLIQKHLTLMCSEACKWHCIYCRYHALRACVLRAGSLMLWMHQAQQSSAGACRATLWHALPPLACTTSPQGAQVGHQPGHGSHWVKSRACRLTSADTHHSTSQAFWQLQRRAQEAVPCGTLQAADAVHEGAASTCQLVGLVPGTARDTFSKESRG